MKLFSYVVARDFGFAPNPYFGVCTLATCKPKIRNSANVGDWVLGTGSATKKRAGHIVYAMQVSETMSFTEYWNDTRFKLKKPNLFGSKKQAYGDNIYNQDAHSNWSQLDSHHSYENGVDNIHNVLNDTQVDRILIGDRFCYWGGAGPQIPLTVKNYNEEEICAIRGYKCKFTDKFVTNFEKWLNSCGEWGYLGDPINW